MLLPASGREAPKAGGRLGKRDLRGSGTILVADDEAFVRRAAQHALERHGYQVLLAENGREAIDLALSRGEEISLILMDLTMPVLGGEAALRELRRVRPDVRIVLSSGFSEAEAVRKFGGYGVSGFIQKPYSAARLAEKVKAVLGSA